MDQANNGVSGINPIQTSSAMACQLMCQVTSKCNSWTWANLKYPDLDKQGNCWLKRLEIWQHNLTENGLTSGPKICLPECFLWSDGLIDPMDGGGWSPSALACQAWCHDDERCRAWTWHHLDHEEEALRGMCNFRKSSIFDRDHVPIDKVASGREEC